MTKTTSLNQKILGYGYKNLNEHKGSVRGLVLEHTGDEVFEDVTNSGREIEGWLDGGPGAPPGLGLWIWEGSVTADQGDPDVPIVYDGSWRRLTEPEARVMLSGEMLWPLRH